MGYDINAALEAYSHSMGNRIEELAEYCAEHGVADRETEIMAAIDKLQSDVLERIATQARAEGPLSGPEIETLAAAHCRERAPEIDETGVRALLRWIAWMAWHKGCMK